ncbi:hypothetical protein ACIOK4_29665 [Streptomyces bottropensis]|uniref:hypothetical protein n=1 Tax=Streptomyces bottropensis TaxID=42235 RepID=UPI0037934657
MGLPHREPQLRRLTDSATAPLPIAHRFGEVSIHVPADLADRARAAADQAGADSGNARYDGAVSDA